ncbi:MAG: 1-(5-phosphoribosyl)-5-amino-4-imidazole-carboxylate carboxylase, partial [Akkermansiaceae bacterium]|nr:1-(5-phosphoribosyl)-5-amino-4-imidazole-carboxylate carboxylase [Akkermansiaceae bacterium]
MSPERLKALLDEVAAGATSADEALDRLRDLPFADLGHTSIDHHRELRTGLPEAVYGAGKSAEQLVEILERIRDAHHRAMATRVSRRKARLVGESLPGVRYDPVSRLLLLGDSADRRAGPGVVVACAGTSDLRVAEEAAQTLEFLGHRVERLTDVGVAGVHRLFDKLDVLRD